jgi:hypothetical protein
MMMMMVMMSEVVLLSVVQLELHQFTGVILSACPRNLFALWEEYEFGLNGQKPAKKFTSQERDSVRYKYTRRKIVWGKITLMIWQGHTYLTAIDELYRIYGAGTSATDIINRMRTEQTEGHV